MAHNPPRPKGLDTATTRRVHDEVARQRGQLWHDLDELADLLIKRASTGKTVSMKPATASFIAMQLRMAATKPTRDEVAAELCRQKTPCEPLCYDCRGKANKVVRIYGQRPDAPGK